MGRGVRGLPKANHYIWLLKLPKSLKPGRPFVAIFLSLEGSEVTIDVRGLTEENCIYSTIKTIPRPEKWAENALSTWGHFAINIRSPISGYK